VQPPAASAPRIERSPAPPVPGARFSVVIPTWNNLPYLQLCLESLRRNSSVPHEVILHVNEGTDGTREWVRGQGLGHTHSERNAGVCWGINAAAALARTPFVVYLNDDMYACPGWDAALWAAVEAVGHHRFFLSATMIEPGGKNRAAYAGQDFGRTPAAFREAELLQALPRLARPDWSGASWPPNIVSRELWELVGGYSVEFSPGHSSDYDFSMKLWRAGVREFRGVAASKVYHFGKVSTSRLRSGEGRGLFARKWGIPASWFYRSVLRMGQDYAGPLPEMEALPGYAWARLKARRYLFLP
jgi:glycosyltransferase involved in cell wall biosynthesis